MRKITDYNEFMELWNISHKNKYWGNKKITLEEEQNIIEKANIKDFKRYSMYILNDNYHFIVFDEKWTINNIMYYDDETEESKITLESFKKYNEINIQYYKIEENEPIKHYYFLNYYNNDRQVVINRDTYYSNYCDRLDYNKKNNLFVSFLTDDEIEEYNEIVEDLQKKYNERLENYYKKYKNKIYASGYWANR